MDKIPMTAEGYTTLEAELKHCQQERPRIIQQISEARSHGDLSENAEYHAAKETQSLNEGRIAELEDKLARAEVIDVSKLSGDTITFGATVTLIDEDTDKKAVWQIVGEPEADAKKGKISITSPLARALVGKKKGVQVEVMEILPFLALASGSPTICQTAFFSVSSSISVTVAPNVMVSPESLETSITSARASLSSSSAMRPSLSDWDSLAA